MELLLTVRLCFCFSLISVCSGANFDIQISTTISPTDDTSPTTATMLSTTVGECSDNLRNVNNLAVYEGELNTLMNLSANPQDVQWKVKPTNDELETYTIIDFGGNREPSLTGLYDVNQEGLIIKTATTNDNGYPIATSGLYLAQCYNNTNKTGAKLLVVRSGPACSCNSSSPNSAKLSCSVMYADNTVHPIYAIMTWIVNGAVYTNDTTQRTRIDPYVFGSTSTITVDTSTVNSYECQLTFSEPTNIQLSYVATNAPKFNASCSTPICWEATATAQTSTITSTTAVTSPTTATSPYTTAVTTTTQSVKTSSQSTATTMAVTNITQSVTSYRPTTITTAATTTTQSVTTSSRSTTTTKATFNFLVDPAFGPIAGGTKVAVTDQWSELHGNISVVYFGSNLLSKNITRSGNNVTVITPPTDASAVGQSLPISVEILHSPFNVSINKSFTYAPNPEVHDVNPKVLTLSGGMRLTVTGSNLSSVAKPLIRVVVAVKRGDGSSSNNESFAPCEPATEEGTQMICLSPPIYIPDDFLDVLFVSGRSPYTNAYRKRRTLLDSTKTNSRRKRQAQTELYTNRTYSGKNELDKLSIYIGAVFDGYSKYIDDILRDNPAPFGIFFPPTLTCPAESEYDPNTDDLIKIKGEDMSRCCNADSYIIHLGNDFCNVTELTDNQLTCKPPKTKPEQTQSDIVYCDQNIAIFVNLGYRTYKCSCLKYTNSGVTKLITIIVATVGSSLVFFIVIILASVIIKKVKNSKKTYHQDPQVDETRGRRGIVLRSWQSEPDRPGLTSDDNRGDIPMGQDEYRSYINPSEGDSYRGASYNGGYARDIGGNDHQDRHSISDDHDDYLERDDRGNWKEDSSKGRRTDNE